MSATRNFSFIIVGGGILGSALANLAAAAGQDCLVLRRSDAGAPVADTLRNQGWLQSGVMYPINQFADAGAYAAFAARTFTAGRELLAMCGLSAPKTGGILGLNKPSQFDDLAHKRRLLRFPEGEFRLLEPGEAELLAGAHFEPGTTYYRIPDAPFDEAGVLSHFRKEAVREGAAFIEVDGAVRLERLADGVRVTFDGQEAITPIIVITAGAGSIALMGQCGIRLKGELQRTPLFVGSAPKDMPASVIVDRGRGFSAVRHERGNGDAVVVMGTRIKLRPAPDPTERLVPLDDQKGFVASVPPGFQASLEGGRYTAGYELMPIDGAGVNGFQPWIHAEESVIFASPGRATATVLAVQPLLAEVLEQRSHAPHRRTSDVDLSQCRAWERDIAMHYMPSYSFNDAEA